MKLIKDTIEIVNRLRNKTNLKKPFLIVRVEFKKIIKEFSNNTALKLLKITDLIHVTTNSVRKILLELFNLKTNKVILVPCFLNLDNLNSSSILRKNGVLFKKKYNLVRKKIILFVGTKSKSKGIFTLVKAVSNLYKKDKRWRLITVGKNTREWFFFKIFHRYKFLLDFNYVTERVKEIFFSLCDIFCMPSIIDSFGLVYLEAWHKKKAVVGGNIEPIKEIIEGNRGGFCVKWGDIKELETVLEKLFKDYELSEQLGKNGHKALMKKYTLRVNERFLLDMFLKNKEK